jgi:hypothetical protein
MTDRGQKVLTRAIVAACFALAAGIFANPFAGRSPKTDAAQSPRWNPLRVPAGANFVGDQTCAECHRKIADSAPHNSMWRAMETGAESAILSGHPELKFRLGSFTYQITRRDGRSFYTVTDGKETISLPIHFAFGQGKAGQTYVLEHEGAFYESRVSFYNDIRGLDFTVGSPRGVPKTLTEAMGRKLPPDETLKCFGCHSTGALEGPRLRVDRLTPGVRCEACHGPGGEHVAAGRAGQPNAAKIFNPGRLGGDELSQVFCGTCHGSADNVAALRNAGELINVRFQPYRIFNSACYADDRRVSCAACHDPHGPLKQEPAHYDAKCLACHLPGGKSAPAAAGKPFAPRCPTGTQNCAGCHMPKVEPPGAHFKFTDHLIRVVKPGERFPN